MIISNNITRGVVFSYCTVFLLCLLYIATKCCLTFYCCFIIFKLKGGANINTQGKKSTQIFLGVLSGVGVWILGLLMSGRLAFVEDMELYPTGKLILAFPIVFAVLCVIIAKYSARTGKRVYYISSMVSLLFPLLSMLISTTLGEISDRGIPVISYAAEFLIMFFMLPYVPMFSISYQVIDAIDGSMFAMMVCIAVALAGVIVSVIIYKKEE